MQKNDAFTGMFTSLGRALDESMGMMSALRSGRLSRAQFDEWYDKRRREGGEALFQLRDSAAGVIEPIGMAMDIGRGMIQGQPGSSRRAGPRRRVRRRARSASASVSTRSSRVTVRASRTPKRKTSRA